MITCITAGSPAVALRLHSHSLKVAVKVARIKIFLLISDTGVLLWVTLKEMCQIETRESAIYTLICGTELISDTYLIYGKATLNCHFTKMQISSGFKWSEIWFKYDISQFCTVVRNLEEYSNLIRIFDLFLTHFPLVLKWKSKLFQWECVIAPSMLNMTFRSCSGQFSFFGLTER